MYARQAKRRAAGLPVTDSSGRAIGRIVGREYQKLITRPDQILRSPPGFGFDVWAMDQLVLPRVDRFVVISKLDGRVFTAATDTFRQFAMIIDRGAGPQYVLPLAYWQQDAAVSGEADSPRAGAPRGRDPEASGPPANASPAAGSRTETPSSPGRQGQTRPPVQGRLL